MSATASGVTTYSVFGYSDPVSASTTCATTSSSVFSSSVTSVINGCLSVGSYVNSNAAASVYAVINSIDISGSGKKFKAKFFSDKSCKTAVDASQKVIDTKITTRQALSGTAIYGKLAATTAPYVFYTVADTSDTPFAVAYVTNLCQDVSTLSLTNTKSLHVYLDGASATPYAVGFSKTTCTADSTNVAGSPLPITLQLKTASTLTCQKVSSDLYAKIKQDGSDDYKFAFTFYK